MKKCLSTTGTKCLSYSFDSADSSCAFSSTAKADTSRSITATFYEITKFNFPAGGVTFSDGDCKWATASDNDWSAVAGCSGHTTRKACVSDSSCAYQYYSDDTHGFSYFGVMDYAVPSATSPEETFSGMSVGDCAAIFIIYGGETANTRLSYTFTTTGGVCKLYADNEQYTSSGTPTESPDTLVLESSSGTTFYGLEEK